MKEDQRGDGCSTGDSSFHNGFYKNLFNSKQQQSTTPICMFYFAHPFGISTPSSTSTTNMETTKKKSKKSTKYTTTTYLVTEIQKNVDESSQDECCDHSKSSSLFNEHDMIPWPQSLLLPPPIIQQLLEKKKDKKLADIDALLRQVRKQAWNTPKSHRSYTFWSRGSSLSSEDFSALTSPEPDSITHHRVRTNKRRRRMDKKEYLTCKRQQIFLSKRRYSVPEIIMRKYSLAQQKAYEESTRNSTALGSPSSCCGDDAIKSRNGQSSPAHNNCNMSKQQSKFLFQQQIQSQSTTRVPSPAKYFLPLSPQPSLPMSPTPSSTNCGMGGGFVSGGTFFNCENISMRKQALLRRMWSREFQHTKYSGSWSPPLKRVGHLQKHRFEKFHTLPEVNSSTSCEKCRELGVLGRSFDEDAGEAKENKSQQTDDSNVQRHSIANQKSSFASSSSSGASTVIHPIEQLNLKKQQQKQEILKSNSIGKSSPPIVTDIANTKAKSEDSNDQIHSKTIIDANGNNIIICMSATSSFQDQKNASILSHTDSNDTTASSLNDDSIKSIKNASTDSNNNQHKLKQLQKQFSTHVDEIKPPRTPDEEIYKRLREDKLSEEEIDTYISRMLIDNLNNVIRAVVNENLKTNADDLAKNRIDLPQLLPFQRNSNEDSSYTGVGRNLMSNGEDGYEVGGGESQSNHENYKFTKQQQKRHEMLSLQVGRGSYSNTTPENGGMQNIQNCNETSNNGGSCLVSTPLSLAVLRENLENVDAALKNELVRYRGQIYQSIQENLYEENRVAAVISTGTSYQSPGHPETIFVPRVLQAKTESMEVNPSSSSAIDDDDFDEAIDSGGEEEEEFLSDVDSIDGFLTMRESKRLGEFGYRQHKKAQAIFKPIHLKGQAFFVPIVDTGQPIDEQGIGEMGEIVIANTMPYKLREKLLLRQRELDVRRHTEMQIKKWQRNRNNDRKYGEKKFVQRLHNELEREGGSFKIVAMPPPVMPKVIDNPMLEAIPVDGYRRDPMQNNSGGWMPKNRPAGGAPNPSIPPTILETTAPKEKSEKSEKATKSSKNSGSNNPRNGIVNLESYKIDGRGNMQIQNPAKTAAAPAPRPRFKARKAPLFLLTPVAKLAKSNKLSPKTNFTNDLPHKMATNITSSKPNQFRMNTSSKRTPLHTSNFNPPVSSSASSVDAVSHNNNVGDVRRRQIMKDVQQMSIYNDLTPDPDSGPSRKMWKTEIKEGDKHIEILEIVECVEGTASTSSAPEHFNFSHSFPPQPSNHKINFHVSSTSSTHPTIVNTKTFSVKTTTTTSNNVTNDDHHQSSTDGNSNPCMGNYGSKENPSRIPVPVYRYARSKYPTNYHPQFRDKSPYENNYSSSTDDSLTSAGSSIITNQPQSSTKVDRMIANLLMEALKTPDELGIEFTNAATAANPDNHYQQTRQRRRSLSPNGDDSSSTGYYTGDSISRRSASNSAGKYHHRFEVIPEEKSSYTMESSNDDFIDDEEENDEEDEKSRVERLNEINSDWKVRKDLENNDIKTRSSTPNKHLLEKSEFAVVMDDDRNEEENEKSNANNQKQASNKPNGNSVTSAVNKTTTLSTAATTNSTKTPSTANAKSTKISSSSTLKTADIVKSKKTSPGGESSRSEKNGGGGISNMKDGEESSSAIKSEDDFFNALLHHRHHHHHHHHARHKHRTNNNNHSMSNKTSSSTTPSSSNSNNKHVHYHLYQYQSHNCCSNLPDQYSKTSSSAVTTAASSNVNENFSANRDESQNQSNVNTPNVHFEALTTADSTRTNFDDDAEKDEDDSIENVIDVEITNKNYHKDDDKCSCTEKYVPYKINEKNVWQVYETSDCKYIQSRYEINEVFEPSSSKATEFTTAIATESTATTTPSMLYSRSNFSDRIIYQARNQDEKRESSTENCTPFDDNGKLNSTSESLLHTPASSSNRCHDNNVGSEAYNIDDEHRRPSCKCVVVVDGARNDGDDESATATSLSSSRVTTSKYDEKSPTVRDTYHQSGKLLNRPKATNNISRDQVKPVEKEIQNEITQNGSVKAMKALKGPTTMKPISLPSATAPKLSSAQKFDDDCGSSASSVSDETVKENKKGKMNYENEKQQSLMRQENKVAIPNIHQQGWSVTVAGTHPELAPDVEMKLSFPKANKPPTTASSVNSKDDDVAKQSEYPEVFFYKNNQLLPANDKSKQHFAPTQRAPSEFEFDSRPYYNNRRSLSLARIDSGVSSINNRPTTRSYLPNLHVSRSTGRNCYKEPNLVECTTISASKTRIIPNRRSMSLGNRRISLDNRDQAIASPVSSEMLSGLSVVGSEVRKNIKPRVKTMSERDLTKRHVNCFTRSNGYF